MTTSTDPVHGHSRISDSVLIAFGGLPEVVGALTAWALWLVHRTVIPSGEWFSAWIVFTGTMVALVVSLTVRLQRRVGRLDHQHVREMEHRAVHDELTGLATRSEVERRLEVALADAYRRDLSVGVLFLDLDGFKAVNDNLGHSTGDKLLRRFARRLEDSVRIGDVVGRVGGDEFVVVTVGPDNEHSVMVVARHIRRIFERPIEAVEGEPADGDLIISPSIGVAVASRTRPATPGELLEQADRAMYRAKRAGVGVALFDEEHRRELTNRRAVHRDLIPALAASQFRVHYQPIVSARSGRTVGFEGLIRWQHPTRGTIGPDRFLEVAEEAGLLARLGEIVLREVADQLSIWNHIVDTGPPLSVSVNLAERQLMDVSFPDRVAEIVEWAGISASQLDLEMSEEILHRRVGDPNRVVRRLSEMGCRMVIDNFASIDGSIPRLASTGLVNVVKLDRESVVASTTDDLAEAAIASTVLLAHSVGIDVVAQGVETPEQRNLMTGLGVDFVQGYLLLEPSPAEVVDLVRLAESQPGG